MAAPLSLITAAATTARSCWGDRRTRSEQCRLRSSEALSSAAARADATLTVDLSGVEYLDSGGLNVLFAHADRIHIIANPVLMPVLKISGLTDVASVEAASPRASG